jgi:beta-lactamase superfamily II metal-dependent hydrolase
MLATWMTLALLAAPQDGPPVGLTVVVADVGQGDCVVVRAPDGTVHCLDAGKNGQGSATVVPLIQSLQPSGYGYTVCSHYHSDHLGGLDTVLSTLPFQVALDRGNVNTPTTTGCRRAPAAAT